MVLPAVARLNGPGGPTVTTEIPGTSTEVVAEEFPFLGLEAAFDAVSRRHLASTGLGPGWDCWEVGAGSGSVARWLADRVRPSGSVLATDVDTTGLMSGPRANLRVVEHDLVWDPYPAEGFQCIHARLVLGNMSERQDLLARLASALAPGGWLLVEDLDLVLPPCSEVATGDERLVHKVRSGFGDLLSDLRGDLGWARSLPPRLGDLRLEDVGASDHLAPVTGGSVISSIERANLSLVKEQLIAFGVTTDDELDRCLQLLDDPGLHFTMPVMVSAWGRRVR